MMDLFKGKMTPPDWIFVAAVLAATAIIFVGFYFAVYARYQDLVKDRRDMLAETNKQLHDARQIALNIDALREESVAMLRLVEVFEKRLPEEREIPMLLSRFERLGGELGLRVQLASQPTSSDARTEIIPYRVTAEGPFHLIVSFINMLERDERYLKISNINIGEESGGISTATFILSTFRFIQSEPSRTE